MDNLTGVERAYRYMRGVSKGTIPACEEVRQAVQRQYDDLEREDFEWRFDEEIAERAIRFCEMMPHTKGREFVGKLIKLEDWQCFIITTVFGWVDLDDMRRFKAAYVEVPRKNAKSTLSAAIGLYLLVADGEPGSEVYSAATTQDQAKIVFDCARGMVEKLPKLREVFDIDIYGGKQQAGTILENRTSGVFKPLAADSKGLDGLNIHCGIIDELHAHPKRNVYDVIETATGARQQPLIWSITTAGFDRAGICYEQRSYIRRVLSKRETDDSYFGIIYTIDIDDDWTEESSWIKANPNWGISVNPDDIRRKAKKAIASSASQNNFLTKHLDKWVNASVAWMNMAAFENSADKSLSWDDVTGPIWIGLDLSSRVDIAAINYTWIGDNSRVFTKSRYFLPQETVENETNDAYDGWVHDGHMIATPGAKTDFKEIEEQIRVDCRKYEVAGIAYDPFQAQYLVNNLAEDGLPMVEFNKTIATFSAPMKEWEAIVAEGSFVYDGNPVTTWMVSNVEARYDARENVFPVKPENNRKMKIDGADAQIMALAMAIPNRFDQSVIFL